MLCGIEPEDDFGWDAYDADEVSPEFSEGEDEDDDGTDPCPRCGVSIYGESERCPICGEYLTLEEEEHSKRPWWVVFGAIGALAGMFWLLF